MVRKKKRRKESREGNWKVKVMSSLCGDDLYHGGELSLSRSLCLGTERERTAVLALKMQK